MRWFKLCRWDVMLLGSCCILPCFHLLVPRACCIGLHTAGHSIPRANVMPSKFRFDDPLGANRSLQLHVTRPPVSCPGSPKEEIQIIGGRIIGEHQSAPPPAPGPQGSSTPRCHGHYVQYAPPNALLRRAIYSWQLLRWHPLLFPPRPLLVASSCQLKTLKLAASCKSATTPLPSSRHCRARRDSLRFGQRASYTQLLTWRL